MFASFLGTCVLMLSGLSEQAVAQFSTVGGGQGNIAAGSYATVAGGFGNTATGNGSAIAGGLNNSVSGVGSFAAGSHTSVEHDFAGALAFCDGCNCASTMSGTLSVCVDHGFFVNGVDVMSAMDTVSVDMANMKTEMALMNSTAMGQSMATMESATLDMRLQITAMNASMVAMMSLMQQTDVDMVAMNASMAAMEQAQEAMAQMTVNTEAMAVAMDDMIGDMDAMNVTMAQMDDDVAQMALVMTAMQSDMTNMQAAMQSMQTASSFVDQSQTTAIIAGSVVAGLVIVAAVLIAFFVIRAQKASRFTNQRSRAVTGTY